MKTRTIHYPDTDNSNRWGYYERPTLCGRLVNPLDAPTRASRSEWPWGISCKSCIRSNNSKAK